jgi:hypothetical protein
MGITSAVLPTLSAVNLQSNTQSNWVKIIVFRGSMDPLPNGAT